MQIQTLIKTLMIPSALLLVSACNSVTSAEKNVAATAPAPESAGEEHHHVHPPSMEHRETLLGALPAEELSIGSCKLFLWAIQDDRPLVFIQEGRSDTAVVNLRGQKTVLTRTAAEDPFATGAYTAQTFQYQDLTIEVDLRPEAQSSVMDGIKIPHGLIALSDAAGQQVILSVTGLYGCRTR
ncbi:hypothetical protein GCM10017044_09660 [Kordiimonas sediminis]|uniref:Lipoprotein n=1 Tax=Kordiimonas sediminis TaxID=1735581 RepID=A0A919AMS0_9PROT|nr:hypothetical protein [Kordiimonas sediminis]GHF17355.1 hypothetical protein GCM10017044_09660 [Kordiimonas sediminis]